MMVKTEAPSKRVAETKRKRENQKENRLTKRHSPDECRDAVVARTKNTSPPPNKHTVVEEQQQSHGLTTHLIPGCNGDEFRSLCTEVSQVRDQAEWSVAKLRNAPSDIGRVQSLISHLMLVGVSAATDKLNSDADDSGDELTHDELTLDVLHDQCHVMLKGLHHHLQLLFDRFEYKPLE